MMRNHLCFLILLWLGTAQTYGSGHFSRFFSDATMRVDYFHTGTAGEEFFSLDRIYVEGQWPGSKVNLRDTLNLGTYLLKIIDLSTNQLIYSRGYCTIFNEWQTTPEAKKSIYRTMHESVRFPLPKNPVQLSIAKRNSDNLFTDCFSTRIDPQSRFVNREKKRSLFRARPYRERGAPEHKVDVVILGDGYTESEMPKFRSDVKHYTDVLFRTPPFDDRKNEFNVWMIEVISGESGIDEPRKNKWKDTALGASYNSLDSPRYVLSLSNKEIRDIAGAVPYDFIYILVNSSRYGGGGIYQQFATCYTGVDSLDPGWWADYVFVHEFGHSFAGLGDEYYTSDVAYLDFYSANVEPWEPNITASVDSTTIKWASMIPEATLIPTAWPKAAHDSLRTVLRALKKDDPLYREKKTSLEQEIQSLLGSKANAGIVGCYEGAGYASTGLYRPAVDCRMFSKSLSEFCPVCHDAIVKMIRFFSQ